MDKQHVRNKIIAALNEEAKELKRKYTDSSVVHRVKDLIDSLVDSFDEEEQNPEHLSDGDLVVSPVELQLKDGTIIPAGHAFKFTEDLSKEIKSPLYSPTMDQAMDFARRDELREVEFQIREAKEYIPNLENYRFYQHVVKRLTKDLNSYTIK